MEGIAMKRKIRRKRRTININLPSWLKLRMSDSLKNSIDWMKEEVTLANAQSLSLEARMRGAWKFTIKVERI